MLDILGLIALLLETDPMYQYLQMGGGRGHHLLKWNIYS